MKKLIIIIVSIAWFITLSHTQPIHAQIASININVDIQPAWGPSGYQYASYYYIPALNIYYDVNNGLFIYPNGRKWITNHYLPKKFGRYDFYLLHKVVLNNLYNPWTHNKYHRRTYAHFHNSRSQTTIYYATNHHYRHAKQNHWAWVEPRYMPTHRTQKHLTHRHSQINFNTRSSRSTVNNNRSHRSDDQRQIASNNRAITQKRQSEARNNRIENSTARTQSRSAAANKPNNKIRKNESKQIEKSQSRDTKRSQQSVAGRSKQIENKSTPSRIGTKKQNVEKRTQKSTPQKNRNSNNRRLDGRR